MTPLEPMVVGLGILAGLLIGAVGIGGVVIVPALVYFAGLPVHAAIAGAMMGYLVTGFIGTIAYARAKSIRWDVVGWLWAGAMPAALAGALAANLAPPAALEALIGLLTASSGLNALSSRERAGISVQTSISKWALCSIGAATGLLSALSGTGGPLILVPTLMYLDLPVLTAIGLSQSIQLPIAVLATAANIGYGSLDLVLGGSLGIGLAFGTWIGAGVAHAVPRVALHRMVAGVLIVVGASILIKLGMRLFP